MPSKNMNEPNKRISLTVWDATKDFLERQAIKNGCSTSNYASHVLNQHFLSTFSSVGDYVDEMLELSRHINAL